MSLRGFTYGHYELLARLPSGAPLLTFLARQRGAGSFKKLVCLRLLIPSNLKNEAIVETFLSEARLAAHINHPAFPTVYDLGKERGAYYISMEYVAGETVSSLIDASVDLDELLPQPVVASIAASVCDGLHYMHELHDPTGRHHQLVHGDISPRNLIITYEGYPKVLDFGVVQTKIAHHGRVGYPSPEHQQGKPLDRRADIYALGLVLYEALASCALGASRADDRTDLVVGSGRPPPKLSTVVPGINSELEKTVERAIAASPNQRFATAEQLAEGLRGYLAQIGFNDRRSSIADLLMRRTGDQIARRTRTLERLLHGDCDERELESVLGARPADDLEIMLEVPALPRSGRSMAIVVPKTQVVSDAEIIDEHTDEVDAIDAPVPDPANATGELWGDRTEHDDPELSSASKSVGRVWTEPTEVEPAERRSVSVSGSFASPKNPISDAGAIAQQSLSAGLARGVALADVGAIPQEPVETEDNPTMPRLKLHGDDIDDVDLQVFSLGPSQLPPIAEEPSVRTSERMAPKPSLPLALGSEPKRVESLVRKLIEINELEDTTSGFGDAAKSDDTPSVRPRSPVPTAPPDSRHPLTPAQLAAARAAAPTMEVARLGYSGEFQVIEGTPLEPSNAETAVPAQALQVAPVAHAGHSANDAGGKRGPELRLGLAEREANEIGGRRGPELRLGLAEREVNESGGRRGPELRLGLAEREANEVGARRSGELRLGLGERDANELGARRAGDRDANEIGARRGAERDANEIGARRGAERDANEIAGRRTGDRDANEIAGRRNPEVRLALGDREANEIGARRTGDREANEVGSRRSAERDANEIGARRGAERDANEIAGRRTGDRDANEIAGRRNPEVRLALGDREANEIGARRSAERDANDAGSRRAGFPASRDADDDSALGSFETLPADGSTPLLTPPLPQLPGGYATPPPPAAHFDPNTVYISRSAAIKLMIIGVSVGLFLGVTIAFYFFTRAH